MLKKILLVFVFVYLVFGFILFPAILRSQLGGIVEKEINAKLAIEDVYFNPINFKLIIEGISLKDPQGTEIASARSLAVDMEPRSLFAGALHVKSVLVQKPFVGLVLAKDGSLNFSKLPKEPKAPQQNETETPGSIPRIVCDLVAVEEGVLKYEDLTRKEPYELVLSPLGFKLENIDTKDFSKSDAELRFHTALTDGGEIGIKSAVVSLKPFKVQGSIEVDAVKLYTQWRYFQELTGVEVAEGTLSLRADYKFALNDLNATRVENISVDISSLRVKPKSKNLDILNMDSFYIREASVEPLRQRALLPSIGIDTLHVKVKRGTDGAIDWANYLLPPSAPKEEAPPKQTGGQKAPEWDLLARRADIKNISLVFDDESVSPGVKTTINRLDVSAEDITLSGKKPFAYKADMTFNDKAICSAQGSVTHSVFSADANLTCSGIDIARYAPYIDAAARSGLSSYNLSLQRLEGGFDVVAVLTSSQEATDVHVKRADVHLDDLILDKKEQKERVAEFKRFEVVGAAVDTKTKSVNIEKVALVQAAVNAKRDAKGIIDLSTLVVPREAPQESAPKSKKSDEKEPPYRVKIGEFALSGAKALFEDMAVAGGSKTIIDPIALHVKDIDSKENTSMGYELSLGVNAKGSISSKGTVKHTPLEQKGSLKADSLSLSELTPYIQETALVELKEGYLSIDAKTAYKQTRSGHDAAVSGGLSLDKLFLLSLSDASKIASLKKAKVDSFEFKSATGSLNIGQVELDSLFVDVQIDKEKSLNLSKLIKENKSGAEAPQGTKEQKNTEEFSFVLKNIRFANSQALFADYSLPVEFKTRVHDISGEIGNITNKKGESGHVDINGIVDKYGSAKLKGSLEPSDVRSFLDLELDFQNLDLSSASGYSAQFAGYKIDEGRLFLDLGYFIKESKLESTNSIVIKNIKLGDAIEDENITKLPLGFAVALLEDKDGVIDIELPIKGDIDNPDFKYGAIVVKTIVNLIVKAVASPFKFLGALMGIEGEELKYVEFDEGEAMILPPQREKLDKLSDMLLKKPKLGLEIIGGYDDKKDSEALALKRVRQKSFEISKQEQPTLKVLEKIYLLSDKKESLDALKEELKKRVKKDSFESEYQKELLKRCVGFEQISKEELASLAKTRQKAIKNYLFALRRVEPVRLLEREEIRIKEPSEEGMPKSELQIVPIR